MVVRHRSDRKSWRDARRKLPRQHFPSPSSPDARVVSLDPSPSSIIVAARLQRFTSEARLWLSGSSLLAASKTPYHVCARRSFLIYFGSALVPHHGSR